MPRWATSQDIISWMIACPSVYRLLTPVSGEGRAHFRHDELDHMKPPISHVEDTSNCASGPPQISPFWSEAERLKALDRYEILDTPREPGFDDIARLAADIFNAPIAVVNLIAEGRQWFKAEVGIGADELPLEVSICAHAILQPGIFIVPDTTADPRFACNPLVTGDPGLRFYAGRAAGNA